MRTEIAASHLRVTPGIPVTLEVTVTNTSTVIDGVTATIDGLDPTWVQLVAPVVSLFPESSAVLSMRIDLPTDCLAGEYLVTVRVASIIDADRQSDHEFWLSVEPVLSAELVLRPSLIIGGKSAVFDAMVVNTGNIAAEFAVTGRDETRIATSISDPPTLSVGAGQTEVSEIEVTGPRPWFGSAAVRTVIVEVNHPDLQLRTPATFTQKPRIPRGALTILILILILALWATVFIVVVNALGDSSKPTKATATDFNGTPAAEGSTGGATAGGSAEVDLTAIGGSMAGVVTAQNTGAPQPRITVEAFRVVKGGALDATASAATGDDGTFSLESLLPGSYKLRFSADGFDELWFPAAPDAASAEIVRVEPAADVADLAVVLTGQPGSLSGEVVAPESPTGVPTITVTVTEVIEKPVEGDPPPEPIVVTASGNAFTVPGLATPGTYSIMVESPSFETQQFEQTLGAGENSVINSVQLGAAAGSLAGTVTDGNGKALGGVEVTIRSGDFEKKTKTPTSGNIGAYSFDQLVTPRTYVLTFTLAGYDDLTIALALDSGANSIKDAALLGGTGNIAGAAFDAGGNRLGGVKVIVAHGALLSETSTLTDGNAGLTGTYSVTALPTPDFYTVTCSLIGYEDDIQLVGLASAASQADVNCTMRASTATVVGQVTSSGTGVGEVLVTLTNGGTPRSTTTSSAPGGNYQFDALAPGSYTLTASKIGYVTQTVIITVAAGDAAQRSIPIVLAS